MCNLQKYEICQRFWFQGGTQNLGFSDLVVSATYSFIDEDPDGQNEAELLRKFEFDIRDTSQQIALSGISALHKKPQQRLKSIIP